jgi:hypothetical protein
VLGGRLTRGVHLHRMEAPVKNEAAVTLGRMGGIARAKKLTAAQRKAIARKGGTARARKAQKALPK